MSAIEQPADDARQVGRRAFYDRIASQSFASLD
jgi:hypothetical protein